MLAHLFTLKAHVVGISVNGKARGVLVKAGAGRCYGLSLVQALVLQSHQCLPPHILKQHLNGLQQITQHRVLYTAL